MARTLRLEIVTPEAKAYSEDVEMVVLPGTDGELGVYPQHVPVLTTLKPGELRVLKGGRETSLAVGEGFAEITGESISVLTDMALESSAIDEAAAEAAVARAQAAMKEDHVAQDVASIRTYRSKALAQLTSSAGNGINLAQPTPPGSCAGVSSPALPVTPDPAQRLPCMQTPERSENHRGSGVYPSSSRRRRTRRRGG
jgi:F-type H+-transporting ATPase subunit epsilon